MTLLGVLALLAALALIVWFNSTGVSTRNRWRGDGRFGQLVPEPPWPTRPADLDARFGVLPRRRIVVPGLAAGVLVPAGTALLAIGLEPAGVAVLVVGLLEAGAGAAAAWHNRRAVGFVAERLRDGRSGSGDSGDEP